MHIVRKSLENKLFILTTRANEITSTKLVDFADNENFSSNWSHLIKTLTYNSLLENCFDSSQTNLYSGTNGMFV